mmetsp:Transcript_9329/g.29678  ORF Transcript_9329/g.29678 Transcript_9329/m.29678 type:complete len:237 (-) Transcript_9329:596-1306(-)
MHACKQGRLGSASPQLEVDHPSRHGGPPQYREAGAEPVCVGPRGALGAVDLPRVPRPNLLLQRRGENLREACGRSLAGQRREGADPPMVVVELPARGVPALRAPEAAGGVQAEGVPEQHPGELRPLNAVGVVDIGLGAEVGEQAIHVVERSEVGHALPAEHTLRPVRQPWAVEQQVPRREIGRDRGLLQVRLVVGAPRRRRREPERADGEGAARPVRGDGVQRQEEPNERHLPRGV